MSKPELRTWLGSNYFPALRLADDADPKKVAVAYAASILEAISNLFSRRSPKRATILSGGFQKYDTDQCLFEVLCYVLYRMDVWIFAMDYVEFRETVYYPVVVQYCLSAFRSSVNADSLPDILNTRMEAYSKINREETDIAAQFKKEVHCLVQYLLYSAQNGCFQANATDMSPLILAPIDAIGLQTIITSHLEASFPWHKDFVRLILTRMSGSDRPGRRSKGQEK